VTVTRPGRVPRNGTRLPLPLKKGCTCGFTSDNSVGLSDHFSEMFTPADDMGADGKVHLEQVGGLSCCCGFSASFTEGLDGHFSEVFPVPADRIGRDGKQHAPARSARLPRRRDGEHGISPAVLEALSGLDHAAQQAISEMIALCREFPAWAVWMADGSRPWTAIRVASARAPGPRVPVIWTNAATATQLADRMRRAEAQLSPP
jgi:hypothetical protein